MYVEPAEVSHFLSKAIVISRTSPLEWRPLDEKAYRPVIVSDFPGKKKSGGMRWPSAI